MYRHLLHLTIINSVPETLTFLIHTPTLARSYLQNANITEGNNELQEYVYLQCVYVYGWSSEESEAHQIKHKMYFLGILESEKLLGYTTPSVQRFNVCGIGA